MGVDLNRNFDVDFGYVDEITLFQTEWQEKKEDKDQTSEYFYFYAATTTTTKMKILGKNR